jgi:hypothetical protein
VTEATKMAEEVTSDEETVVGEEKPLFAADSDLVKQSPIVIQVQEVPIGC